MNELTQAESAANLIGISITGLELTRRGKMIDSESRRILFTIFVLASIMGILPEYIDGLNHLVKSENLKNIYPWIFDKRN